MNSLDDLCRFRNHAFVYHAIACHHAIQIANLCDVVLQRLPVSIRHHATCGFDDGLRRARVPLIGFRAKMQIQVRMTFG